MNDLVGTMMRRWSIDLATGREECLQDAVDVRTISTADRTAIEDRNADIHEAMDDVLAYEAAVRSDQGTDEFSFEIEALAVLRSGLVDAGGVISVIAGRWGYPVEITVRPPVPDEISDWQFATVLKDDGIITQGEAEDFCGAGLMPAAIVAALEMIPDDRIKGDLRIKIRGAKTYYRTDYATQTLASLLGYSADQVADIWTRGAAIT